MKKVTLIAASLVVFAFATFGTVIKTYATRWYSNGACSGSGGDCLDTVVVTG